MKALMLFIPLAFIMAISSDPGSTIVQIPEGYVLDGPEAYECRQLMYLWFSDAGCLCPPPDGFILDRDPEGICI